MNKAGTILSLGLVGLFATAMAQAPAEKPLTEQDLLKKIDVLNTPQSRPRLGLEGTGLDEKKRPSAPQKEKGPTTITSNEVTFDHPKGEAVFTGKVVVKDPEFNVQCDRLDAFLKKDAEKPAAAANPPPTAKPPEDKDKGKSASGGGLDHAIADANPGNIVVITQDKIEADGSISKNIGKGRRATYDAKTGDVVLTGNPSVQQGNNLCEALNDSTVMTLNRDGRMKADGPTKVVIKDSASLDGK
jgi:lipopolysaccharide export system protein LptA